MFEHYAGSVVGRGKRLATEFRRLPTAGSSIADVSD